MPAAIRRVIDAWPDGLVGAPSVTDIRRGRDGLITSLAIGSIAAEWAVRSPAGEGIVSRVRRALPLSVEAARPQRHTDGGKWRVERATAGRTAGLLLPRHRRGRPSHRRLLLKPASAAAARGFSERAIAGAGSEPRPVTTGKAPRHRGAVRRAADRRAAPEARARAQPRAPPASAGSPWGPWLLASTDACCRGHAPVRNLRDRFPTRTSAVPRDPRLATAWPVLARVIRPAAAQGAPAAADADLPRRGARSLTRAATAASRCASA
jgi:hypothetical protein